MRLLILGNWHCQSNAHQYSLAFRRLGHDVTTVGPRFTPDDAARWRAGLLRMEWPPTPEEADAYVAEVLAGSPVPDVELHHTETVAPCTVDRHDAVLYFDAYGETPGIEVLGRVPSALVIGDSHTGRLGGQQEMAPNFRHLFLQFRRADLAAFDHPSKHWLPPAADPRVWVHVPDMPKEYDVLFCGSTDPQVHKERVELIRFLKRELGEERVVVKHLFGERAALAMNRAKVVLNRSLAGDLNMRVPEALCTGTALITDDVSGLEEFGGYWDYKRPTQARSHVLELCKRGGVWLDVMARARRQIIVERHTYEHRAQLLLDVLFGKEGNDGTAKEPGTSLVVAAEVRASQDVEVVGYRSEGRADSQRHHLAGGMVSLPRVSIIIPVFNHWGDCTWPLLKRLSEQRLGIGTGVEIVVVDDGSTDETATTGTAVAEIVRHTENKGFAAACNTGARVTKGEYLVFLNNDTEPQEGWLAPLLAALDEGAGIAGPVLDFPDGRTQSVGLEQRSDGTWWNKEMAWFADGLPPNEEQAVSGACLAIRRDTFWRLGGFDESFEGGGGCEDVDLCLRAGQQGVRVVLVPKSLVMHKEGSTRGALPETAGQIARNQARLRERWGLPEPESNATRVVWDGPTDVSQHGSLALINSALTARLGLLLAGTRLGTVRISHRWTGVDRAWEPPGNDIDHWCVIAPWEIGQWPYAWNRAFSHEKFRCLFTPSEFSRQLFLGPPSGWNPRGPYISDLTPEKVRVVPNGVDLSVFRPDGERLGVAPGTEGVFRVLFVGGLIRRKGIDLLYDAWRRAFTPEESVRLVLKAAGTRTFYQDSTEWPPADLPNVQLLDGDDYDSEWMAQLYRSCDVLVLPSRGEAFGLPVLEAIACGTPVVVPEGGPFDEYVPVGGGLRIPLDAEALARAVRWCYLHWDRLPAMGQVGHAAAQAYGWDAIAQKYAAVIQEVCR